jgi:hypothetical protein
VTIQNQGGATARNHALQLSQGDYIQWLDGEPSPARRRIVKYRGITRYEAPSMKTRGQSRLLAAAC